MLSLETVRCPREFIEPVVEVIRNVRARLAPWFGRFGRKVGIEVGGKDGLSSSRMNRVCVEIDGGGVSGGIIGAWFLVGRGRRFPVYRLLMLDGRDRCSRRFASVMRR